MDAESAVPIGIVAIGRLHKLLAGDLFHGAQHCLVAHPASPQGELKDHLFRRLLTSGHLNDLSTAPAALDSHAKVELPHGRKFSQKACSLRGTRVDTLALWAEQSDLL